MNDRKFYALLNLYLDGQLDSADAVEFEHEILQRPDRRRVYSDYCRIHRATRLVYDSFRSAATERNFEQSPVQGDPRDPVGLRKPHWVRPPRGHRRFFRPMAYWATGLAAACASVAVAVITIQRHFHGGTSIAPTVAIAAETPAVLIPAEVVAPQQRENGSFAAPFAAELRLDPYVSRGQTSDPFGLKTWKADLRLEQVESFVVTAFPAVGDDALMPARFVAGPIEGSNASRTPSVFRSRANIESSQFEPVGYQVQR